MKSDKRTKNHTGAFSRLEGGIRALLGKMGRRVQAWLGRNQPEAIHAHMPLTSSSTEKMLRANERLTGWNGMRRGRYQALDLGDVHPHRGLEHGRIVTFSDAISGRYRLIPRFSLALALPLAHPLGLMGTLPRRVRIGRLGSVSSPFPPASDETRRVLGIRLRRPSRLPQVARESSEGDQTLSGETPYPQALYSKRSLGLADSSSLESGPVPSHSIPMRTEAASTFTPAKTAVPLSGPALLSQTSKVPVKRSQEHKTALLRWQPQHLISPLSRLKTFLPKRRFTFHRLTPSIDEFALAETDTFAEKKEAKAWSGSILKSHMVLKEERQKLPVQQKEMGLLRSPIGANILDLPYIEGRLSRVRYPKEMPLALTASISDEAVRRRLVLPRATKGKGLQPALLGLGWRSKSRVGSGFPRSPLFPKASHQLVHEIEPGRPLPSMLRTTLGRFLGRDFGDVRVHSEPAAAGIAATLKAEAFTVGREIFFGSGRTKFDTPSRIALLGHELSHVARGQNLRRPKFGSILETETEEKEASANEFLLWRTLRTREEESSSPARLTMSLASSLSGRSTAREPLTEASPAKVLPSVRSSTLSMELAKAAIDRPRPTESQAPATSPPTEGQPPRPERELDIDALARQVYDLLKRRLTLEREMIGYR